MKIFNKWNFYFWNHTNKTLNKAHAKIIELYVIKSKISPIKIEEMQRIDSEIESWKWTVEFNRDRQRFDRYPLISIGTALMSGVIGSLLAIYLTK
ncbi:MAG: hypothetical protein V4686_03180 [Patescibacteria group bacterium]